MTGPNRHIRTFTGREFSPFEMTIDDIDILDIAHSHALSSRYNGHTFSPLSIAQHCVWGSLMCTTREAQRQFVVHDASEAYIHDISKWVKAHPSFAFYREQEDRIQRLVYEKFDCPLDMLPEVKHIDGVLVRFEGVKGFGPDFHIDHPNYPDLTPDEIRDIEQIGWDTFGDWWPWEWRQAKHCFLERWKEVKA